jgi:predicted secreted protein
MCERHRIAWLVDLKIAEHAGTLTNGFLLKPPADSSFVMRTFGLRDGGKQVALKPGEDFALELPETPTTGFRWHIMSLPPMVRLTADNFVPPVLSRPGAAGVRRWTFEATATGSGTLFVELRARTARAAAPNGFAMLIDVVT